MNPFKVSCDSYEVLEDLDVTLYWRACFDSPEHLKEYERFVADEIKKAENEMVLANPFSFYFRAYSMYRSTLVAFRDRKRNESDETIQ